MFVSNFELNPNMLLQDLSGLIPENLRGPMRVSDENVESTLKKLRR